jgi:hypothetical protein
MEGEFATAAGSSRRMVPSTSSHTRVSPEITTTALGVVTW